MKSPLEEFRQLMIAHEVKTGRKPAVIMLSWSRIQALWDIFREGSTFETATGKSTRIPPQASMPFRVYGVVIRPIE